jgi:hypothetical protein
MRIADRPRLSLSLVVVDLKIEKERSIFREPRGYQGFSVGGMDNESSNAKFLLTASCSRGQAMIECTGGRSPSTCASGRALVSLSSKGG